MTSKNQRLGKASGRLLVLLLTILFLSSGCVPGEEPTPHQVPSEIEVTLPEPRHDSDVSIEETLLKRRSVRELHR